MVDSQYKIDNEQGLNFFLILEIKGDGWNCSQYISIESKPDVVLYAEI